MKKNRVIRKTLSILLIFSIVFDFSQFRFVAKANDLSHTCTDSCFVSSTRPHVHTGSQIEGTGCYTLGEYVPGKTHTCGELDSSDTKTSESRVYGTHTCCYGNTTEYKVYYRCKGCGEYIYHHSNTYCDSCDYYSWGGMSPTNHTYYVAAHYELGCGKTEGIIYDTEIHQDHPHCSEKITNCAMCSGAGKTRDHQSYWQPYHISVVTGYSDLCPHCGWEDEDGIPWFKYECSTCGDTMSVRGCCRYEISAPENKYCYKDCDWCSSGKIRGYFDTCDGGCVQHNGHTMDCFTHRYFDANGNLTSSYTVTPKYFNKIHNYNDNDSPYITGIDVDTWTIYGHGQWKANTPAREAHIYPSGYACGGQLRLRYKRANLFVYCSDSYYDYTEDRYYNCGDYITVSAPLYMCDSCGSYKYYPDEIENKQLMSYSVWNDYYGRYTYYYTLLPTIDGYYRRVSDSPVYKNGEYVIEYEAQSGSRLCGYGDINWGCSTMPCHRTNGIYYDPNGGESIIPAEGGGHYYKWLPCSKCKGTGQTVYPPCPHIAGEPQDTTPATPVCNRVVFRLDPQK